ncbi:hypothetical protein [Pengzhenrongella sp.]|jgi:hypothetical protein|uniref:hypothetical protein n=1 Tax=Pengzhenrongella sp. TaxID=2888820 RepID=UPI002F93FEA7
MSVPSADGAAQQARESRSALAGRPDAQELKDRSEVIDREHADAAAAPVPPKKLRPMSKRLRRSIGVYLLVIGLALLAIIPWAWSVASNVVVAADGATVRATFLGRSFTPTAEFCLAMIVLLTAMIGSVVVLSLTFSSRAGHETLERGYLWWYLTRPISSAGLGLLFYLAIIAGFFDASGTSDRQALTYAAAIGGLSGLFTDQVLKKMRGILGLLPTHTSASDKDEDATYGVVADSLDDPTSETEPARTEPRPTT